ncbi:uncharacterized protein METZ01_LOCUS81149 [marine metagenome]|uniref:Uncharacterized protein n=1 Tax=marine metagenome TaxID=408172 RepID=A0A381UJG0_9ZZZZ
MGCVLSVDGLPHRGGCALLGCLSDLAGAQTAGANTDSFDASVDYRSDHLNVCLESPRGHIVGVADVTAYPRTLTTNFTPSRHFGFSSMSSGTPQTTSAMRSYSTKRTNNYSIREEVRQ